MSDPTPMWGEVVRTERIGSRMVRVVLGGPGLEGFTSTAATDQYVNALFLPEGSPHTVPFTADDVRDGPNDGAPRGRRETVRHWDADAGELWIDFVTHGDVGFAGKWAHHAQPGDRLQVIGPSGSYRPDPSADWHLMAGDESALPAIAASLDAVPDGVRVIVLALVDGPDDEFELTSPGDLEVRWIHRCDHVGNADALLDAVAALDFPAGRVHAFVHGEAAEVRSIRKHLVVERGVAREGQSISPYWRRNHTDEQWREIKRDWVAASDAELVRG